MKRAGFIALIVGIAFLAFSSLFIVRVTGTLYPVQGGIADSERFSNVLMDEDMTAWLHGHEHTSHDIENSRVDKWGTTFIDDGSMGESLFLKFEDGSKQVEVRSRNNIEGEWNENLEGKFSFKLDYPFNYDGDNLKVWVFSDIQPTTDSGWATFEKCIEDADESMDADIALILGDLVDHGASEEFEKFLNHLENSTLPLENFYSLAGNHEYQPYFTGDHSNYEEYIVGTLGTKDRKRYTLDKGNVKFLFMSDDKPGAPGVIGEKSFEWWRDIVKTQQDNTNYITLTHQPLEDTTIGSKANSASVLYALGTNMVPIAILLAGIGFIVAYETSS